MDARCKFLSAGLLALLPLAACDRSEALLGSKTVTVTPRVVRSASVTDSLWNSTADVAVSAVGASGVAYLNDTVPFSEHKVSAAAVPNDQALTVSLKGMDTLRTVLWSGRADLPATSKDTTFAITVSSVDAVTDTGTSLSSLSVSVGNLTPSFSPEILAYVDTLPSSCGSFTVHARPVSTSDTVRIQCGSTILTDTVGVVEASTDTTVRIVVSNPNTRRTHSYALRAVHRSFQLGSLSIASGSLTPSYSAGITSYTDTVSSSLSTLSVTMTGTDSLYLNGTKVASGLAIPLDVRRDTFFVALDSNVLTGVSVRDTVHVVHRIPRLSGLDVDSGAFSPGYDSARSQYVDTVSAGLSVLSVKASGSDSLFVNGVAASWGAWTSVRVKSDTSVVVLDSNVFTGKASRDTLRVVHDAPRLSSLAVDSGALTPYFSASKHCYWDAISADLAILKVTAKANDALFLNGSPIQSEVAASVNVTSDLDIVILDSSTSTGKSGRDTIHVIHRAPKLTGLAVGSGTLQPSLFSSSTTSYVDTVPSNLTTFLLTATGPDSIYANGVKLVSGVQGSVSMPADGLVIVVDSSLGTGHASRDTIRVIHQVPQLTGLSVDSGTLLPAAFSASKTNYLDSVSSNLTSLGVTATGADSLYVNGTHVASGTPLSVSMPADGLVIVVDSNLNTGKAHRDTIQVVHRTPVLSGISVDSGALSPSFTALTTRYLVDTVSRTDSVLHVVLRGADSLYLNGVRVLSGVANGVNLSGDTTMFVVLDSNAYTKLRSRDTFYVVRGGTFTDARDGQAYKWVKIGTQVWMAQNLNYRNTTGSSDSVGLCYNKRNDSCSKYGRNYTWSEAMGVSSTYNTSLLSASPPIQGVCPSNWHVPTYAEWHTLITTGMDSTTAGTKLKSISGWNGSGNGTNAYGFAALPAGMVSSTDSQLSGASAFWWCTMENATNMGGGRYMNYAKTDVLGTNGYKTNGSSLRCVRD